jgi:hypothetical protein
MNPLSTKRSSRRVTLLGGKGRSKASLCSHPCRGRKSLSALLVPRTEHGHRIAPELRVDTKWPIRPDLSANAHITLHRAGHQDHAQHAIHDHNLNHEVVACPLDQVRGGRHVEPEVLESRVQVTSRDFVVSGALLKDEFTSAIFFPNALLSLLILRVDPHASQDIF